MVGAGGHGGFRAGRDPAPSFHAVRGDNDETTPEDALSLELSCERQRSNLGPLSTRRVEIASSRRARLAMTAPI
jgi:hypothetical protein